ncbi:MAG: DUF4214 domain-containing protein [Archangium sp.]|nr:DUF4214 domain-containing protein [Archangium sp.]
MTPAETTERRFALAMVLLLPWLMLLVTDWTVTPVGMVDGWIYRALGRDLVHANASFSDFYYPARPFVLVPRFLLTRLLSEGVAHAVYSFLCFQVLLLAVFDLLTSLARPGTRLAGVLLFGTCMYLLRTLGWGYVDGSIVTWFVIGLAGLARWYRTGATPRSQHLGALVAGGCFIAMLTTHPMTLPMLLTPLALVGWRQSQTPQARPWRLWLVVVFGAGTAVVAMAVICKVLYGRSLFFMPVVHAALELTTATWKHPLTTWVLNANWLVLIGFACLVSVLMLAGGAARKARLTAFEGFAYLNLVALMALMVAVELFTGGYWLEYGWFASYFLPAALLALAAMLGERTKSASTTGMEGLAVALVVGAALAYRLEAPYVVRYFDQRFFPFRLSAQWLGAVPLATLQAGIALCSVIGLVTWRWLVARPGPGSLFFAGFLVALVNGAPINRVPPGDALESAAAASVSQSIGLIQDELAGRSPRYWYDDASPFAYLFQDISAAHLGAYSRFQAPFPDGAQKRDASKDPSDFFAAGLVILDDTAERFPRAQRSFADVGYALKETRREQVPVGERSYSLIIATVEPARDAGSPSPPLGDDVDYVKGLYRDLLGREADAGGLRSHLDALAHGFSREKLRQVFLTSPEYRLKQAASAPP